MMRIEKKHFFGKEYKLVVDADNIVAIVIDDPFETPPGYIKAIPPGNLFYTKDGESENWFLAIGSTVIKKEYLPRADEILNIWHGEKDIRPLIIQTKTDCRFIAPYRSNNFIWGNPDGVSGASIEEKIHAVSKSDPKFLTWKGYGSENAVYKESGGDDTGVK